MEGVTVLLICCEGKRTEPEYFQGVVRHQRITQGQAKVKVIGGKGQHKILIDEALSECSKLAKSLEVSSNEIEVWAVCDKDEMTCTLKELEDYAKSKNVNIAFSNPKFEIFLLQHFCQSSTNQTGKSLDNLISKELSKRGISEVYHKTDISWLFQALDNEPQLLRNAIKNSSKLIDKDNTPYTTVHVLLERLVSLAP